jgi:hypothetical protein
MNHSSSDDPASIEITLIVSADPLTKTYCIGADGVPQVSEHPFLSRGVAQREHITNFATEFADLLTRLDSDSSIVLGALSDEVMGDIADITTKAMHCPRDAGTGSPIIWSGNHWISYRPGEPAILGLDHDAKEVPSDLREAHGGAVSVLHSICPALADAASVARPCSSTGIRVSGTGETSAGGGWHFYAPILDGGDAADFVSRLHDRLLEGYGAVAHRHLGPANPSHGRRGNSRAGRAG